MARNLAPSEEVELSRKHEEILGKRAVLLSEMERMYEQQKKKSLQLRHQSPADVTRERNSQLLQDLQVLEERLRTRQQMPHPDVLTLETRYWTSVEEKIPEWEPFLLGKGPHPSDTRHETRKPAGPKQKATPQDRVLPTQVRSAPQDHAPTQVRSAPQDPAPTQVRTLPPRPNLRTAR